jgi:hypothetical protein
VTYAQEQSGQALGFRLQVYDPGDVTGATD